MDLETWRKARAGEAFTLPSGLDVQLKRVQLLDLAEQGRIPTPLLGLANEMLAAETMALTVESWSVSGPLVSLIAGACLAGPPGLTVEELPVADRLAIYNWANEVLVAVRPFRPQPNGAGDTGRAVQAVRTASKRDTGR